MSKHQIFKLYFRIAPFILGELTLIGGCIAFVFSIPKIESLLCLLIGFGGGYFVHKKVKIIKTAIYVTQFGKHAIARLTIIKNTNQSHNDRTVKTYSFAYFHQGKVYYLNFNSAYHRQYKHGQTFIIFYDPNHPNQSFIPSLYGINPDSFLN